MTAISSRAEDAFDNPAKSAYRARHLHVLREQAPELWKDGNGSLLGAWLELVGSTGWLMRRLLIDEGAIQARSFVGVDLDTDRIAEYRTRFPESRWLAGDLLDLIHQPELEDVAVVHFDGYEAAASPRLVHIGEQLMILLRRAVARFGAAALIWNTDLDACRLRRQSADRALHAHAGVLAAILREAVYARRMVRDDALLAGADGPWVARPKFIGTKGAFEIYRGTTTGHRMACLRAILR